jgi:hypothetical protein
VEGGKKNAHGRAGAFTTRRPAGTPKTRSDSVDALFRDREMTATKAAAAAAKERKPAQAGGPKTRKGPARDKVRLGSLNRASRRPMRPEMRRRGGTMLTFSSVFSSPSPSQMARLEQALSTSAAAEPVVSPFLNTVRAIREVFIARAVPRRPLPVNEFADAFFFPA